MGADRQNARGTANHGTGESLPLFRLRAGSSVFLFLEPQARQPIHRTRVTNVRARSILPLIVPEGCAFRVGGETREWRKGEAFA